MYRWVTHTHSHLAGQCPHECVYCYVDNPRFGRPAKYRGPLRLVETEFCIRYGSGKTIFMENCGDLFANEVPQTFIDQVMAHCHQWPDNMYVWQTKNPSRYHSVNGFPVHSLFGTTIETNRDLDDISKAPRPVDRMKAMAALRERKFITVEPILNLDVDILSDWIAMIQPEFVNIGADSKNHALPEPSAEKISELVNRFSGCGIEVREKHNLSRLKRQEGWLNA